MKKYYFLIIVALIFGLVLTGCSLLSNIGQAPSSEQSGITYLTKGSTLYVDDDWQIGPPPYVEDTNGDNNFATIQAAINAATDGDTIEVAAGTYIEVGQIFIDKDLSINGEDEITTIINPAQDTGGTISGSDSRAWFYITPGTTFNLSKVTLDGTGCDIRRAIVFGKYNLGGGNGTIEDNIIKNMFTAQSNHGVGIATCGNLTIKNNIFSNLSRAVIYIDGGPAGETIAEVSYNTVIGKGDVTDRLDNGIEVGYGAYAYIHHNTVSNCRGFVDPWKSVAIYVHHDASADIRYNTINNNTDGIEVGYYNDLSDTSTVSANFNNIVGNTVYGVNNTTSVPIDATYNWWGHSGGPRRPAGNSGKISGPKAADQVSENVLYHPWLSGANPVSNIALDKAVTASATWETHTADLAVDGDYDTSWNAGLPPTQWIEIDLSKGSTVVGLRLLPGQFPAGFTTHVVLLSNDGGVIEERTFSDVTERKQWLEDWFDAPVHGVKTLRVTTTVSPSWVAWFEIEVYGWQ